jgi:hypothetical protein
LASNQPDAELGRPAGTSGIQALERRQPAAEEQDRGQEADQDHVGVFGQEEQREREPEYSTM